MKNAGVILAVGLTALVVATIAAFSFMPRGGAEAQGAPPAPDAAAAVAPVAGSADPAAVEAAFAAREALIQAQIQELDRELADRNTDYAARAAEMADLVATGEAQLAGLSANELALRGQVDELSQALTDRAAIYAGQRAQAAAQYQTRIAQLKAQMDEANAKLADARAQLGQ